MGPDRNNNLLGDDSFLTGAIFMSNRATKEECFNRKLFGLPSSRANFVKKIKIGMILFLFEYEERKLHGVFQATSDGAMNIIPMAFRSSGKLFSAQVCFRTICHCYPLTEAEFQDAIRENYYAPNKFHFHLSGTQVYKLLHLFESQQHCNRCYRSISESRHPRKNGSKKYQNFRSGKYEPNKERNTDLNMYPDLPGTNLDQLTHHKRPLQNVDDGDVHMEAALHPSFSHLEDPELPDVVHSASRVVHAFRGNTPVSPKDDSFYHQVPGLHLKKFSMTSGMNNASVKELAYSVGSLGSHPSSRYQCYYSHPDKDMQSMSSVYQNVGVSSNPQDASYTGRESSSRLSALASKDIREGVSVNNLQDSITGNFQKRMSINNLENFNFPSSLGFGEHYAPDISSSNQGNYTKLHLDVATSVHSPGRIGLPGYGHCATASQSDDNSRGPRYFRTEHHEIVPSSEYEPNNLEIIEPSLCSSPEKASSRMMYGIGFSEYQDEGSSYCHLNEDDEYHLLALRSKFHSESQERTSAFLRLSGLEKAHAEKAEYYHPNMSVSFDELVRHLSSRCKYWSRMTEVPTFKKPRKVSDFKRMKYPPAFKNVNKASEQFVMLDDDNQLENVGQLSSQPIVLCKGEQSCRQEGTDGTIVPFLINFKRRSEAQRIACGTETSNSAELSENAVSSVKCKRRKLIRPSFGEEGASNKVDEVQNVPGETQGLFLKGKDGESNENVDTAMDIGNEAHADSRGTCGARGESQGHLVTEVQVTLSEQVGNVRPAPAAQIDVANQMKLSSEGTICIEGKSKFQIMQESSQNLHGGPLLVVDGSSSGGYKCNANGGKEMETVNLSHAPHNDNSKADTTDVASGGQCKFQNMQGPSEHLHRAPLFIKVGDSMGGVEHDDASHLTANGHNDNSKADTDDVASGGQCKFQNMQGPSEHLHRAPSFIKVGDSMGGVEHDDASHLIANGSERRRQANYLGGCTSCSCYLEGFSKMGVCQTSAGAAQDIEAGEPSSNRGLRHGEATEVENIKPRLHLAEFHCKNTEDPQGGMSNIREDPSMKVHFTESDGEMTGNSQRNLFNKTAVGVGHLPSATCVLYSAEGSRDPEEAKVFSAERGQGFDGSAEGTEMPGLLSYPCTVHTDQSAANTGKATANTEDHLISGGLLSEVIEKDKKKPSCSLPVGAAGPVPSDETPSNPVIGSSGAAESTQQGKNEVKRLAKLDGSCTKGLTLNP